MRILYLNHTSRVSGAEYSLLTMLGYRTGAGDAWLAAPVGELANRAAAVGCRVVNIPEFDFSFRTSLPRLFSAAQVLKATSSVVQAILQRHHFDVVHANSLRAGLIAAGPASRHRVPYVVHLRDASSRSALGCLVSLLALDGAAAVAANSAYTLASARCLRHRERSRVINEGFDAQEFDPAKYDRSAACVSVGIPPDAKVLTVIGQITPWKAQDDAIRVLDALTPNYRNLHLLIVGEPRFVSRRTRYDNIAFMNQLRLLADSAALRDRVHFLGHREDVPTVLAATDVLLVPSLQEPFGRTVVEGMAMAVPVVATSIGGPAEIISEGETGLLRQPRRPAIWAEAVADLLADAPRCATMGAKARDVVLQKFSLEQESEALKHLYQQVLV